MIKFLKSFLIVGIILLPIFYSCHKFFPDDTGNKGKNNIPDLVTENGNLSILDAIIEKCQVGESMSEVVPLTIFAPGDAAFQEFFVEIGVSGVNDLSVNYLIPLLSYHMVNAIITSEDFFNGYMTTLGEGPDNQGISMLMNATENMLNSSAMITESDIIATKGVIHIINKVLVPPTVIDLLQHDGHFTHTLQALDKADLKTMLTTPAIYTIFAPSDAAFDKYFLRKSISGIVDMTIEELESIMKAHIAPGNILTRYAGSKEVATLNGTLTVVTGYYSTVNNYSNIIGFDIQGENGAIQVIDEVIAP